MLVTAVVGMLLAVDSLPPLQVIILGNLGIALCAGSGAAVNHVIDRHIDARMHRTQSRPIPSGQLPAQRVLIFATLLVLLGFAVLYVLVNPLTAWLALMAWAGYALIYTGFLKRITAQNIVIGGLSGAMPPLLGWTAVTGQLHPYAWLLVIIIFLWTPPHFWALAIYRKKEYAQVEIPMLISVFGEECTRLQIAMYTLLMIMSTWLPYVTGMSGLLYLFGSTLCNMWFGFYTWQLVRHHQPQHAIRLFWVSIYYLFALFIILLLDHYTKIV